MADEQITQDSSHREDEVRGDPNGIAGSPTPRNDNFFIRFYYNHSQAIWISLVTLAVAVAGLLTYVLFFRGPETSLELQGEVKMEITGPAEMSSGSELSYEVVWENASNAALTNLVLEIFYPRGFSFLDSTPDPAPEPWGGAGPRKFNFTDLPTGQRQKLVIVGRLEGSLQEVKNFSVKLHYMPENFRSGFVAESSLPTVILAPDLVMSLVAPSQIITGQTMTYEVEIANAGSQVFDELFLSIKYPPKFEISEGLAEQKIFNLGIHESRSFQLSGKILESPGSDAAVEAELFVGTAVSRTLAARNFAFTRINPPPLTLSHRLEGQTAGQTLSAAQTLAYQVEYENTGETGLSNVYIRLVFETPVFNFEKLSSSGGQFQKNTVVFIPGSLPELRSVQPGQKGLFDVTLPLLDASGLSKNPLAKTRVEFSADELAEPISGERIEIKIGSEITLEARVRHISGPKPPVEGEATAYEIDLTVLNTVNDLSNVRLTATIPRADVSFNPDVVGPPSEVPNVQFVPTAGIIRWSLGNVVPFAGSLAPYRKLTLPVSLIPETEPGGGIYLLRDIEIEALDEFTGKKIFSNKIDQLSSED